MPAAAERRSPPASVAKGLNVVRPARCGKNPRHRAAQHRQPLGAGDEAVVDEAGGAAAHGPVLPRIGRAGAKAALAWRRSASLSLSRPERLEPSPGTIRPGRLSRCGVGSTSPPLNTHLADAHPHPCGIAGLAVSMLPNPLLWDRMSPADAFAAPPRGSTAVS
jgi:hypothetical protein